MRGIVAKKMRKVARERTVGKPAGGYARGLFGNAVVQPQTTRWLYRMFKAQWRKGLIRL